MTLYTRPQLAVLLVVVVVAGAGLGVGHWRRTHPESAARLEMFDRAIDISPPATAPASTRPPAEPATRAPSEPAAQTPSSSPARSPTASPARADLPSQRRRAQKTLPAAQPLDVNRATEDELRTLPGIGGVLAARIVESRERDGPFASLDDLRRVPGLGRAKLERIAAAVALPR